MLPLTHSCLSAANCKSMRINSPSSEKLERHISSTLCTLIISINTYCSAPAEKNLATGLHRVSNIFCCKCQAYIGWKYVHPSPDQGI